MMAEIIFHRRGELYAVIHRRQQKRLRASARAPVAPMRDASTPGSDCRKSTTRMEFHNLQAEGAEVP
jgi:hypothetical protein